MKNIAALLTALLLMAALQSHAQTSTNTNDDRSIQLGLFGEYYLGASAYINNNNAFSGAIGGGLKLYIPSFTQGSGNTANMGDWTISGEYAQWSGDIDPSSDYANNYPNWNLVTGMLGYSYTAGGILTFEPQVGYSYGTCSNASYKFASSDVSGITYALRGGYAIWQNDDHQGFGFFAVYQFITTKAFSTIGTYGAGLWIRL